MQLHHELDDRVSRQEWTELDSRVNEKLSDILTSCDARYADKDLQRKKILSIEKNVSCLILFTLFK